MYKEMHQTLPACAFPPKASAYNVTGRSSGLPDLQTPSHLDFKTVVTNAEDVYVLLHQDYSYGDSAGLTPASHFNHAE